MAANETFGSVSSAQNLQDTTAATNIIRVDGLVKWFDVGRGFGFIIPDNGLPDILLHYSCLKRDGFEAPLEGARADRGISKAELACDGPG